MGDPGTTPPVTILDEDNVRSAISSVLDDTQNYIGFPIRSPQSSTTAKASSSLYYSLSGSINATLTEDWEILPGVTLQRVSLSLDLGLSSRDPLSLRFGVKAYFVIDDVYFIVSGEMLNLQSTDDTLLRLTFQLSNTLDYIDIRDFVKALDASLDYDQAAALATQDIQTGLDENDANCMAEVSIVASRTGAGQFFLQSVTATVSAGFDWNPTGNVHLTDLGVVARMERAATSLAWTYRLDVAGSMHINKASLRAKASFLLHETSNVTISMSVDTPIGIRPQDIIDVLVPGTSYQAVTYAATRLPPDLQYIAPYIDSGMSALDVSIVIRKAAAGTWLLASVSINVALSDFSWTSPSARDNGYQHLNLEDIYASIVVTRVDMQPPTAGNGTNGDDSSDAGVEVVVPDVTSPVTWICSASLGGTIAFRNGQIRLAVLLAYNSATKLLAILASIPDEARCYITDVAQDRSFSPAEIKPADLGDTSVVKPVITESPVQLNQIAQSRGGVDRSLRLIFSSEELTRLIVKVQYDTAWQITAAIKLVDMGLLVDLQNPQSLDPKRPFSIKGYVYGSLTVGSARDVHLFAMLAGAGNSTSTDIWLGLSTTLTPNAPINTIPSSVLEDGKFLARSVPQDGWGLPTDAPANVANMLGDLNARLEMNLKRSDGNLQLQKLRLHAESTRSWQIFRGFTIEGVGVDILMDKTDPAVSFSGSVAISGTCSSTLGGETYLIAAGCSFSRKDGTPDSFDISISVTPVLGGATVVPSTVTALAQFGGFAMEEQKVSGQMPAQFPLPASAFTQASKFIFECSANVNQSGGSYMLNTLTFVCKQIDDWDIIPGKLRLTSSRVGITIANLSSTSRSYDVLLSGTLAVGDNVTVSAIVRIVNDPQSNQNGWMRIDVLGNSNTSASSFLQKLVTGSEIRLPHGCPIDTSSTTMIFTASIYLSKTGTSWSMQQVVLDLAAKNAWPIGTSSNALLMSQIHLNASFTKNTNDSWSKNLTLIGHVTFNEQDPRAAGVTVKVLWTDAQLELSVDVDSSTTVSAGSMINKYVNGWQAALAAPQLTADTKFADYPSRAVASAILTFKSQGNSYEPSTLSIQVGKRYTGDRTNRPTPWTLVAGYLVMADLYMTLDITQLSGTPKLLARLHSTLEYTSRAGVQDNRLNIDLIATRQDLSCSVKLPDTGCNFAEMVYVATAGKLCLYGSYPSFRLLAFNLNWEKGVCDLTAVLDNLSLPGTKTILEMQNPRLWLNVCRGSMRLSASGYLAGEAVVFTKFTIPITYELPDGPLRIFGLDVKRIYEMCKRLLEIIEDLEELCLIIADIVGFLEGLEVGLALIALGCSVSAVWVAVEKVFGYVQSADDTHDDPATQNSGTNITSTDPWVVGGTGICNGTPSELVTLSIYPRSDGRSVELKDLSALHITLVETGVVVPPPTPTTRNGYIATYTRPATGSTYTLRIAYAPLHYDTSSRLTLTNAKAVCSIASLLDVPQLSLADVVNLGTIWPKDQFSGPLLGVDMAGLFTIQFSPPLTKDVDYTYYNDSVRFAYVPTLGPFTVTALCNGQPITHSPATIQAVYAAAASKCYAAGPGACSGLGNAVVAFEVTVLDQVGNPFPAISTDLTATISMSGTGTATAPVVTRKSETPAVFEYTRPSAGASYTLNVAVNGAPLSDCPFRLTATATEVTFSPANSLFTLQPPYYVNQEIRGQIICMSSVADRWRSPMPGSTFTITAVPPGPNGELLSCAAGPDGVLKVSYKPSHADNIRVDAVVGSASPISLRNSPLNLICVEPSRVVDFRCGGPGLESLNPDQDSFEMIPVDQYGSNTLEASYQLANIEVKMLLRNVTSITQLAGSPAVRVAFTKLGTIYPVEVTRVLYSGKEISSSPFVLTTSGIGAATNGSLAWAKHTVSDVSTLIVTAIDANKNRKRIGGDTVQVTSRDFHVMDVIDRRDGSYMINYVGSKETGAISVAVNGHQCDGSPYQLPAAAHSTFQVSGLGTADAIQGIPSTFSITASSDGGPYTGPPLTGSALLYSAALNSPNIVPVSLLSAAVGQLNASYTVPDSIPPGQYLLRVEANFSPIASSPYTVSVKQEHTAFTIIGLDWTGLASPNNYTTCGSFQISANLPFDDKKLAFDCTPANPVPKTDHHKFQVATQSSTAVRIDFTLWRADVYTLAIRYDGKAISTASGTAQWHFTTLDQNVSLTTWTPPLPEATFTYNNGSGDQASVDNGALVIRKSSNQLANNQWTSPGWTMPGFSYGNEFMFSYRLRCNTLRNTTEVKIHAPGAAVRTDKTTPLLRWQNNSFHWTMWDNQMLGFRDRADSAVRPDGQWHDILYWLGPSEIRIYEDGRQVIQSDDVIAGFQSSGRFDVPTQVLDFAGELDVTLTDFVTCPGAFREPRSADTHSSREMTWPINGWLFGNHYTETGLSNQGIRAQMAVDGRMFFTNSLINPNAWVYCKMTAILRPVAVVQYRFRIKSASGTETKITLAGNIILRLDRGQPSWNFWWNNSFIRMGDTGLTVGDSAPLVTVTVLVRPNLLTVFEDGQWKFDFAPPVGAVAPDQRAEGIFYVQQLDVVSHLVVILAGMRIVSGVETS